MLNKIAEIFGVDFKQLNLDSAPTTYPNINYNFEG